MNISNTSNSIRIYIDEQTHGTKRASPFRVRVMQGNKETVAAYYPTRMEAERAKNFIRKIINTI